MWGEGYLKFFQKQGQLPDGYTVRTVPPDSPPQGGTFSPAPEDILCLDYELAYFPEGIELLFPI